MLGLKSDLDRTSDQVGKIGFHFRSRVRDHFTVTRYFLIGITMLNFVIKVLVGFHDSMRASIYTTPMVLLVALAADFGRFYT